MAMTPEGKVKLAIDDLIKKAHAYKHKPVQNGMGEPALDYHGCHRGFYFGVEAKAPGGRATSRQILTMKRIKNAGGSVFLIGSQHGDDMAQLIAWLMAPCSGFISTSAAAFIKGQEILEGEDFEISDD